MVKTLELQFVTELGKPTRITIDNPKLPIDEAAVKRAMADIIQSNIFNTANGNLVESKGARVIERNVTDYELV